jgi:hypothetical protein
MDCTSPSNQGSSKEPLFSSVWTRLGPSGEHPIHLFRGAILLHAILFRFLPNCASVLQHIDVAIMPASRALPKSGLRQSVTRPSHCTEHQFSNNLMRWIPTRTGQRCEHVLRRSCAFTPLLGQPLARVCSECDSPLKLSLAQQREAPHSSRCVPVCSYQGVTARLVLVLSTRAQHAAGRYARLSAACSMGSCQESSYPAICCRRALTLI